MTSDRTPQYRPDIDGLRAIAVLAVLASHAGIPYMAGGYVGVDVFFVISGYLITGLILADLDRGQFSFHAFYYRRARRILPPLVLVVAISLIAGYLLLLPLDLKELGQSAVAALLFFPNFHFSQVVGYFDTGRSLKPLLMTWSLGVEEQFYLVFPLLLFAIGNAGARKYLGWILGVGAATSFTACVMGAGLHPDVAYFMPHVRAFELLAGALLALWRPNLAITVPVSVNHGVSVVGLCLVGYSVLTLTEESAFPGINALPPVLGAVLLIGAGRDAAVNRVVLATQPMVFIGTISYSLYLWHWPLLAFAYQLRPVEALPLAVTLPLMALAVMLATASTYLLELPLRRRPVSTSRWRLIPYVAAVLFVAAVGQQLTAGNGHPWRLTPEARAMLKRHTDDAVQPGQDCEPNPTHGRAPVVFAHCPDDRRPRNTVLVWGDSHARVVAPPFNEWARSVGWAYTLFLRPGCGPYIGADRRNRAGRSRADDCNAFKQEVLDYALLRPEVRLVVLSARWGNVVPVMPGVHHGIGGYLAPYGSLEPPSFDRSRQVFSDVVEGLARRLSAAGKTVIFVGPVPELPLEVRRCAANHYALPLRRWAAVPCEADAAIVTARSTFIDEVFARIAREVPNTCVVEPAKFLCQGGRCKTSDGTEIYYRDEDHLTMTGARKVFEHAQPIACLEKFRKTP